MNYPFYNYKIFLSAATDPSVSVVFIHFLFVSVCVLQRAKLAFAFLTLLSPHLKRDEGQLIDAISLNMYIHPYSHVVMVLLLRSANSELHCSTTGPQTI